jgi:hypothetical protein
VAYRCMLPHNPSISLPERKKALTIRIRNQQFLIRSFLMETM